MGGHWVGGEGRLERRVYLIKWNKTNIYLLAHSRHLQYVVGSAVIITFTHV